MVLVTRLSDCPTASKYGPMTTAADTKVGVIADAGAVTALASRVTAVCDNNLPLIDAPVSRLINVCEIMIPSKFPLELPVPLRES